VSSDSPYRNCTYGVLSTVCLQLLITSHHGNGTLLGQYVHVCMHNVLNLASQPAEHDAASWTLLLQ
jgi:hypothetical protein